MGEIATAYLKEVKGLGEFKFIFSKSKDKKVGKQLYMEAFFNPEDYGIVDFLIGYGVDDFDDEINSIENNFEYFIDCAKISCICHLEDDIDGVYTGLLIDYFGCDEEEINKMSTY